MTVAERLDRLRNRIGDAGGDPGRIRLVAVTKGFDAATCREAVALGLHDLGENYAQELEGKAAELAAEGPGVRWHFIGRIQRNKVRRIAATVTCWQSVDRRSAGEEIAKRAPGVSVLVQVNAAGETQKGGCTPSETPVLVRELRELGLDVRGLMAIGPLGAEPERARPVFRTVRELADELGLPERSYGMSADLEVAVAEGATMVRVGTALFGPRRGVTGMEH